MINSIDEYNFVSIWIETVNIHTRMCTHFLEIHKHIQKKHFTIATEGFKGFGNVK